MHFGAAKNALEFEVGGAKIAQRPRGSGHPRSSAVNSLLARSQMRGEPHDGVQRPIIRERIRCLIVGVAQGVEERVVSSGHWLCGHGVFLP